jgi:hypothetical protein
VRVSCSSRASNCSRRSCVRNLLLAAWHVGPCLLYLNVIGGGGLFVDGGDLPREHDAHAGCGIILAWTVFSRGSRPSFIWESLGTSRNVSRKQECDHPENMHHHLVNLDTGLGRWSSLFRFPLQYTCANKPPAKRYRAFSLCVLGSNLPKMTACPCRHRGIRLRRYIDSGSCSLGSIAIAKVLSSTVKL